MGITAESISEKFGAAARGGIPDDKLMKKFKEELTRIWNPSRDDAGKFRWKVQKAIDDLRALTRGKVEMSVDGSWHNPTDKEIKRYKAMKGTAKDYYKENIKPIVTDSYYKQVVASDIIERAKMTRDLALPLLDKLDRIGPEALTPEMESFYKAVFAVALGPERNAIGGKIGAAQIGNVRKGVGVDWAIETEEGRRLLRIELENVLKDDGGHFLIDNSNLKDDTPENGSLVPKGGLKVNVELNEKPEYTSANADKKSKFIKKSHLKIQNTHMKAMEKLDNSTTRDPNENFDAEIQFMKLLGHQVSSMTVTGQNFSP